MLVLILHVSSKYRAQTEQRVGNVRNKRGAEFSLCPFFNVSINYSSVASTASSSASTTGRSTSSTYAIGALSPERKPHFKMRV